MKTKSETIRKCPTCGHEGMHSQFLERVNARHRGGLIASPMRVRCPACGAKLIFKYGRLQLVSTFILFGALIIVIAFFPEYISRFAYSVGVIFFVIYLLGKFRSNKDIFVSEEKERGRLD